MKVHLVFLSLLFLAAGNQGVYFFGKTPTGQQIACLIGEGVSFFSVSANDYDNSPSTQAVPTLEALSYFKKKTDLQLNLCRGANA